ncbi:MAG: hypothetical protein JKX70_01035 [Phycisphaerales bacterium]|nr:hypothetical protein [Phycisphaerales bacterium]
MVSLIYTLVLLQIAPALAYTEPTDSPPPPIILNLIEPDWTLLDDGNWSPWFVNEDGETVWNPSASFNAWMDTIPLEDKAWPILVDLRYKYDAFFSNNHFGFLPDIGEDFDEDGVDDWTQLSVLFEQTDMKPIMGQLLVAMDKPRMGYPLLLGTDPYSRRVFEQYGVDGYINNDDSPNPSLMSCPINSLGVIITAANLSKSYFAYLANKGEIDAFTENFIIMYRGSWLGNEQKQLISTLTVFGSQYRFLDLLRWTLFTHGGEFTEEQLVQINCVIANFTINRLSVIGDQLLFHDAARRVYNIPEMVKYSANDELGDPLSTPYDQLPEMAQTILALYDMPLNGAQESSERYHFDDPKNPKWYTQSEDFETLDFPMDPIGRLLLDVMMPAVDKAASRTHRLRADTQAMRLAIATHRHKLRHGSFPETMEHFDRDLIDFEFIDPFVGGDMLYRLDPDIGPMIYARGYDGDDDQGRHRIEMFLETMKEDGDFVFYPNPWATQEHLQDDE